jgi:Cu+-exporting ATPase
VQGLADRVAAVFVPAVLLIAAVAFVAWAAFGPSPVLAHALLAAISVLIIACPCALGLATPMSVTVGMGRAAASGVLFRNARGLQELASVDTVVVDKTGTLTRGRPALAGVATAGGVDAQDLLGAVATLERASEHPLARALLEGAKERGLSLGEVEDFEAFPGRGIAGRVDTRRVLVGSGAFLREQGIDATGVEGLEEMAATWRDGGATTVLAALGDTAAGVLAVEDPIRDGTPEALADLEAQGITIVVATGDHPATARAVARRLGIPEDAVHAGLLPADKLALVESLRGQGHRVAMAGDGVNDAPALAAADVGLAMGGGADVALEAADVALLGGDLRGIDRARRIGRATLRNIRENLVFAFGYNALGVPIAAGVLYPFTGLLLSPMIAAVAMSASSASVIANALRLRRARI